MTNDEKRKKLSELWVIEEMLNSMMSRIDREINFHENRAKILLHEKRKLNKSISHNMRFQCDLEQELMKNPDQIGQGSL